jgi:NADPH:quinone reductase-like Zn-dependent oxidoreductase
MPAVAGMPPVPTSGIGTVDAVKALVHDEYGSTDVLRVDDVPTPKPAPDEVLVRVRAASINEWDHGLMTGTPLVNRLGAMRGPRQRVLGSDVAGIVEAVGSSVTDLSPGDEVFGDLSGCGFGSLAEYAVAPTSALSPKPRHLTWQQAAGTPQAGVLAVAGLRRKWPLRPGMHVLVNGAGGGVGTFAVQIARAFGVEVTAVDGPGKLEALRRLGATHVMDHTREDFTRTGGYDLIVDVVARHSVREYTRALRPGGAAGLIGGSMRRLLGAAAFGQILAGGRSVALVMLKANDPEQLGLLAQLMEAGAVVPVLDREFALVEAVQAMRYYESGQHVGKIIVTM